ncbi:ExeM/NucH family extracellular endonuclease [Georgenia sp. MJ206]|uniref:ExeM/NucH family extracellular endonuclease n=1 Tax=Georgenia wangjunii TaxID=3117730 RepID=UPI002F265A7A
MSRTSRSARTSRRGGVAAAAAGALLLSPVVGLAPAAAGPISTPFLLADGPVFISEIHYDNQGADVGEAVEVQAPVGTDLTGWTVVPYNGNNGAPYTPTGTLDGTVPAAGVVTVEIAGLQNGAPDGVALVDADGALVEFLSYEGEFTGIGGPADAVDSTDIGVLQSGSDPVGESLQRIDGVWTGPAPSSFGTLNTPPEGPGDPVEVTIAEIQGTGEASPLAGSAVITTGVVTAVYPDGNLDGAYIQTPGTGADLEGHDASHGVFVYGPDLADAVAVGDYVEVTGEVEEFNGLTEVVDVTWEVLDEVVEDVVPAEIVFPETDAEREVYEGMLIAPQGAYTVTDTYPTNRYGSVGLATGEEPLRQPTDVARPGTGDADAVIADNAARAVTLDDGSSWDYTNFDQDNHETAVPYLSLDNPVRVGAAVTFTDPVILDYRFQWNFQPTTQVTGDNDAAPVTFENTRTAAPEAVGGDVQVASFNVLNYFTSLGADEAGCEFFADREGNPTTTDFCDVRGAYDEENLARQTAKIVAAILALDADVVGLLEIENSRTFTEDEDRDAALAGLVDALNAEAGEGTWAYVASPEAVPADEDVIRNAFIYRPSAVAPVGESEILIGDEAFSNAREPVAQEFALVGDDGEPVEGADTFIAIANHFKSKGSPSGATGGNVDQGDGQGSWNADRVEQAEALVDFADDLIAELGTDVVLLLGDFNAYTMEDPMMVLDEAGYTNVGQELTGESTYSFSGLVGSLDHVLVHDPALDHVTGADIWNINAYEALGLEYSRYNYNVTDLYDESPYRSSDHDPLLVGLELDGLVDLSFLAINDFHGRLFDYVEVEDDDGEPTGEVLNATLSFAGTIEELRAEHGDASTLFFSSGDNIGASLFPSSLAEDRPTVELLNALDLATSAVGNHEFDGGFDNLTGQVDDWADFSYLGANVYEEGTETPALPEYATFEVQGLDVAVIGAVTEETPTLVSPAGVAGLDFGDPVAAVNRVAAQLSDGDPANGEADVILAAYHEGAGFTDATTIEDEIAEGGVFARIVTETSPQVDAIFNGHTHKVYAWDGPVTGEAGQFRPVIQGESYGSYVSQVVLTVDAETGDVADYSARNVPVTQTPWEELVATYPRVAEAKVILDEALAEADELGSVVIGEITADITTAYTVAEDGSPRRDDRSSESTLGNLVADALVNRLSSEERGGATIGVVNPGGLRADLFYEASGQEEDGEVTFAEANAVLPFLNELWTLTLTGEQLVEMLEQQWQPEGASRTFLKLGLSENVSYTYDPDAPRGERITSVTVDGLPLDPTGEYRVGTFSFLAQGGDNFGVFTEASDVRNSGLIDRDAWIAFFEESSPVSPSYAKHATVVDPLPTDLVAGETVSFEVSDLDLTSLGSPANTSLQVYLLPAGFVGDGDEEIEAITGSAVVDGAASVTMTLNEDLSGEYVVYLIAEPTGTLVQFPVTITGDDGPGQPTPTPTQPGQPTTPPGGPGLPSTGADLGVLGLALMLMLLGGAVAVSRRAVTPRA